MTIDEVCPKCTRIALRLASQANAAEAAAERLKAENASLLERLREKQMWKCSLCGCVGEKTLEAMNCHLLSCAKRPASIAEQLNTALERQLAAAEQLAENRGRMLSDSMALHEKANRDLFAAEQRVRAAEQRNTALRTALKHIAMPKYGLQGLMEDDAPEAEYLKYLRQLAQGYEAKARAALHDEERPQLGECVGHLGPPSNTATPHPKGETCSFWKPHDEERSAPPQGAAGYAEDLEHDRWMRVQIGGKWRSALLALGKCPACGSAFRDACARKPADPGCVLCAPARLLLARAESDASGASPAEQGPEAVESLSESRAAAQGEEK